MNRSTAPLPRASIALRRNTARMAAPMLACACLMAAPLAYASDVSGWNWRGTLYGWGASASTSTQFDLPGGGAISADSDNGGALSKLKFAFMATLEARRGPWSVTGDAVYVNFGDLKSRVTSIDTPGGDTLHPIDAGTRTELRGFVGTLVGGYSLLDTPGAHADVIAGGRYAHVNAKLDWELSGPTGGLDLSGGVEKSRDFYDAIIGVRGAADIGGNWDVRYYLDGGAGNGQSTWQAMAGIGYRFGWGDVLLAYRHLEYNFNDDKPLANLKLSGPLLGVSFKF